MKTWHTGRLLDHVHLNVSDLDRSHQFYAAVLEALGLPAPQRGDHSISIDELYLSLPAPGRPLSSIHIAFQALSRDAVQEFHKAALASGGRDNGAPGERDYHPDYYAAFALDPDGNNIEAVFHGPSMRSAASVEISPEDQ